MLASTPGPVDGATGRPTGRTRRKRAGRRAVKRRRHGRRYHIDTKQHSAFLSYLPDRLTFEYNGLANHGLDVGTARCNHPFPKSVGIGYFEVEVLRCGPTPHVCIGLLDALAALNTQPGTETPSFGYRSDQGNKYHASSRGMEYGPTFGEGDVVGCGFNVDAKQVFFTKNGRNLGVAFKGVVGQFYAAASVHTPGERVRFNFTGPFKFDIAGMYDAGRQAEIDAVRQVVLPPSAMPALIRDYLLHNGYASTLRAYENRLAAAQRGGGVGVDDADTDVDMGSHNHNRESKGDVAESDSKGDGTDTATAATAGSGTGAGAGAGAGGVHDDLQAARPLPHIPRARSGSGSSAGSRSSRGSTGGHVRDLASHVSGMWEVFRRIYQRASRGREQRLRRAQDASHAATASEAARPPTRRTRAAMRRRSASVDLAGTTTGSSRQRAIAALMRPPALRRRGGRSPPPSRPNPRQRARPPQLPSYRVLLRRRGRSLDTVNTDDGTSSDGSSDADAGVGVDGRNDVVPESPPREEFVHLMHSTLSLRAEYRGLLLGGHADAAHSQLARLTLRGFTAMVFGLGHAWHTHRHQHHHGDASGVAGNRRSRSRKRSRPHSTSMSPPPTAAMTRGSVPLYASPLKTPGMSSGPSHGQQGTTAADGSSPAQAPPPASEAHGLMASPVLVASSAPPSPPALDALPPPPRHSSHARRAVGMAAASAASDQAHTIDLSPLVLQSGGGEVVVAHLQVQRVLERLRQGRAKAALALARRELPKVLDKLSGDDPEHAAVQRLATSTMGLLAYPDPNAAPMSHLLTDAQRGRTADVVNTYLLRHAVRQFLRTKATASALWSRPRADPTTTTTAAQPGVEDLRAIAAAAVHAASRPGPGRQAPPLTTPPAVAPFAGAAGTHARAADATSAVTPAMPAAGRPPVSPLDTTRTPALVPPPLRGTAGGEVVTGDVQHSIWPAEAYAPAMAYDTSPAGHGSSHGPGTSGASEASGAGADSSEDTDMSYHSEGSFSDSESEFGDTVGGSNPHSGSDDGVSSDDDSDGDSDESAIAQRAREAMQHLRRTLSADSSTGSVLAPLLSPEGSALPSDDRDHDHDVHVPREGGGGDDGGGGDAAQEDTDMGASPAVLPVSPLARAASSGSMAAVVDARHLASINEDLSRLQPQSGLERCLRQLMTVHDALRGDTGLRGSVFSLPAAAAAAAPDRTPSAR